MIPDEIMSWQSTEPVRLVQPPRYKPVRLPFPAHQKYSHVPPSAYRDLAWRLAENELDAIDREMGLDPVAVTPPWDKPMEVQWTQWDTAFWGFLGMVLMAIVGFVLFTISPVLGFIVLTVAFLASCAFLPD